MLSSIRLGFVGAGQMAKAVGFPLVQRGILKPSQIIASSPDEFFLTPWKQMGCKTTKNNGDVVKNSDTIIWAVKPQIFTSAVEATKILIDEVDETRKTNSNSNKFHISLMAGLKLDFFSEILTKHFANGNVTTARVMPNIGLKANAGCSVYSMGKKGNEEDKSILKEIFSSGICFEVPESQINAYCALFGSGIGFMFVILEAMSDGAVKMGIPRDLSLKIAAQTMKGAAEILLLDTNIHPGILKDSVCSPGGTTIAGVAEMEKYGIRNGIISAIEAATLKGEEIGKKSK